MKKSRFVLNFYTKITKVYILCSVSIKNGVFFTVNNVKSANLIKKPRLFTS